MESVLSALPGTSEHARVIVRECGLREEMALLDSESMR
jgi:hypothetical protein